VAEKARHLHPVADDAQLPGFNAETGEVCNGCVDRDLEIKGLKTEKRSWRLKYQNLKADKDAKAQRHLLFPLARELFDLYRELTGHARARWTPDRFWLCEPFIERHGEDECKLAIREMAGDDWYRERGLDTWEAVFSPKPGAQGIFEKWLHRAQEREQPAGQQQAPIAATAPAAPPVGQPAVTPRLLEAVNARGFLLQFPDEYPEAEQRKILGEIAELTRGFLPDAERTD